MLLSFNVKEREKKKKKNSSAKNKRNIITKTGNNSGRHI